VRLLKTAGTVTLGKTNMNELAAGVAGANKYYGNAHNPWDVTRWPGGSRVGAARPSPPTCASAGSERTPASRSGAPQGGAASWASGLPTDG